MPLDPSTAVVVVLLPILLALLHSLFSFLLSRRRQLADRLGLLPRTALGVLLPMYECGLPATATCTDADTDVATVATAPRRWALVTGASRGLGRAFALALAADGWGVLCLDLDDDALDAVCAEVAASGPGGPLAATKLACDATDSAAATEACVRAVDALPRGASLRLLVNNVGISTPAPALLPQHSAVDVERLVSINFLFAAQLTRALWPRLAAVAGGCARSRSGILFVSSGASLIPAAFVSVYGATKAALNHLARALRAEAEAEAGGEVESGGGGGHRLDVLAVTPGYVAGAGNTPRWTGATTVGSSPEDVARVRPLICVLWVSMAVLRLRHGIGGHVSRARVCVCVGVRGMCWCLCMEKNDATECKPLFVCVSAYAWRRMMPLNASLFLCVLAHSASPATTRPCCSYMVEYICMTLSRNTRTCWTSPMPTTLSAPPSAPSNTPAPLAEKYTTYKPRYNRTILWSIRSTHSPIHPFVLLLCLSVSLPVAVSSTCLPLSVFLSAPPPPPSLSPTNAGIHTAAADMSERTSLPDAVGRGGQPAVAVPSRINPCPCSV